MSLLHKNFEQILQEQEKGIFYSMKNRQIKAFLRAIIYFGVPATCYLFLHPENAGNFIIIASPILIATFSAWFVISFEKVQSRFLNFASELSGQMLEAFIGSCIILLAGIVSNVSISSFPEILIIAKKIGHIPFIDECISIWLMIGSIRFLYQVIMSALRYDLLDATNQGISPLAKKAYQALGSTIREKETLIVDGVNLVSGNVIIADIFLEILDQLKKIGTLGEDGTYQEFVRRGFAILQNPQYVENNLSAQKIVDIFAYETSEYILDILMTRNLISESKKRHLDFLLERLRGDIDQKEADARIRLVIQYFRHIFEEIG